MKRNKLLERQIRKFIPEECREMEEFQLFIQAVNESYNAYERDADLSERAFRIAEEEYMELNTRLKAELHIKELSINKLREAISDTDVSMTGSLDDGDNELLRIATYLRTEISRREETEQKLQDQRAFYENILNQIPTDIAVVDADHRYLYVNPTAVKSPEIRKWIIGKTDEEYTIYRNKSLEQSRRRKARFDEVVASGKRYEWEEQMVTPSGETEYHLRILHPVYKQNGTLDIMVIYGINITERKRIEEQIRVSEARYRSIFDNSQAIICTHDLEGRLIAVNAAAARTLGYSLQELSGLYLHQLLPEDKRDAFKDDYMRRVLREGGAEGIMVALNREGQKVYLLYHNFMVTDETEAPYVIGFSQDITARIAAERALKKSEEKYRSIIANMNLGLVEVDQDENIAFVNNSFCEMSGYEQDELIGRNTRTLLARGLRPEFRNDVLKRRRAGHSDAYEIRASNKRGELRWWLISGAPIIDANGEYQGSIGIHLDITHHKLLEEELIMAKDKAEKAVRSREVFLANMSHEIRTPMNAILGIGRLLMKTTLDTQQKRYLSTIHNAANNLLVIINDLLDFSKIEAGKISLERIGFNIGKLVTNAVQVLRYKADEKGLDIASYVAPDIAQVLIGDPYRINQVIMNLLGNAIKFTAKGFVSITCSLVADGAVEQKVMFRISDSGIGMDPRFLKHIFDKFVQEDESVTRRYGGTGLGMSICKQLTELMKGTIDIESVKDEGTTVSFVLPLSRGTERDLPKVEAAMVDTAILQGKRVLLAEDNEMNRLLARTILSQAGAEITEAENGRIALDMLKECAFDVVLMDVQMPVMDGLEATRMIRSTLNSKVPIIALTANAFKEEADRCLSVGMNDFISKPFEERVLIERVAKWLGKTVSVPGGGSSVAPVSKLYDLDKIKAISRGDMKFVDRMVTLFINTIPETIQQMRTAFATGEWQQISALAHRIKPSFHNMGINSMASTIRDLEGISSAPEDPDFVNAQLEDLSNTVTNVIGLLKEEQQTFGE